MFFCCCLIEGDVFGFCEGVELKVIEFWHHSIPEIIPQKYCSAISRDGRGKSFVLGDQFQDVSPQDAKQTKSPLVGTASSCLGFVIDVSQKVVEITDRRLPSSSLVAIGLAQACCNCKLWSVRGSYIVSANWSSPVTLKPIGHFILILFNIFLHLIQQSINLYQHFEQTT